MPTILIPRIAGLIPFFLPLLLPAQCSICFSPATNYAAGSNPYGVASADFNNDGFMDLAVANWGSSNVSILLNNGNGTFGAATQFAVGTNPRAIVTADFNGDGNKDFASANDGTNNVSVRLGNGSGGFGGVTNFSVVAAPECMVTADFNGDGNADLATSNYGTQVAAILLGNGSGGFGAATNYSTGASSFPYGICTADFNNDSRADLVTVSYSSNNLSRLTGNGAGGFGAAASYATGSTGAYSACAADFNGDGNPDLAVANANTNNISRLTGNGAGAFGAAATYAAGSFPFCVISADFNSDARMDVAVANYSSNNVSLLMGQGNGTFCAAVNFGVGSSPTSVCTADFNGDGKRDLALTNNNSNNVSVLLNCTAILPEGLLSFECVGESQQGTELRWATATESASDYFLIERSADGNFFEAAGQTEAAGHSSELIHYSYIVPRSMNEARYYRLSLVNFDGGVQMLESAACQTSDGGEAQIIVYTLTGEAVMRFQSVNYAEEMKTVSLAQGIYLLQIAQGNEMRFVKYVKED